MITDEECRWPHAAYPKIPKRKGVINGINKFDAQCFYVNTKLAEKMSPEGRVLLEKAYEAILDSGIHPISLRGENYYYFNDVKFC